MPCERADARERVGAGRGRLDREPLVDDEGILPEAFVEMTEGLVAPRMVDVREDEQRALGVGHVVRRRVLGIGSLDRGVGSGPGEMAQDGVAEPATIDLVALVAIGPARRERGVERPQLLGMGTREPSTESLADLVDCIRIDDRQLLRDHLLGRKRDRERAERAIERLVGEHPRPGLRITRDGRAVLEVPRRRDRRDQQRERQLLAGVPAIEGVFVVGHQEGELFGRALHLESHRRGEAAQDRCDRALGDPLEHEGGRCVAELEHARRRARGRDLARESERQPLAVSAEQADGDREMQGPALRGARDLEGGRRIVLRQMQRVALRRGVVLAPGAQARGPGLEVPALELRELPAVRVRDRRAKIVAGHGLAVVALEVEVHALPEALVADEGRHHPDDLGALLVDGRRVEIVHRDVRLGADGMGHRPLVLRELTRAQLLHAVDALDGRGAHVLAEALIAVDGQSFLQRQLEPVAAGDAVAGPVVEVLVGDDGLDALVVVVGRGLGAGEHELRVEDVETLVLHRPHVEVVDRDDHVDVEVVLAAEALLVPAHRALQRAQRVLAAIDVLGLDPDLEADAPSGAGDELPGMAAQVAGHEREQVARLRVGILPADPATTVRERLLGDPVPVRQQDRIARGIGLDRDRITRHHVRAIEEIRDPAEAHRLALGAEVPAALVEAGEARVRLGMDAHPRVQLEAVGQAEDRELVLVDLVLAGRERATVDRDLEQLEVFAVEDQRRRFAAGIPAAPDVEPRVHEGLGLPEIEGELDGVDAVVGRTVGTAQDRFRLGFTHPHALLPSRFPRPHPISRPRPWPPGLVGCAK